MRDVNGDGERRADGDDGERKKISTALMERGKGVATEAVALEREKVDLERGDGGERERRWRRERGSGGVSFDDDGGERSGAVMERER
ncbi:unnamed protein product [Linum trigynum]|uniref:Uncharacterized protein n=1 Tax=Linum trigynum TaxID=586398 RepID=A0AAV2E8T8_9ROSI